MTGRAFTPQRVHLIGAGGCAMSGLAMLLAARGVTVTGSDHMPSASFPDLVQAGVEVWTGHRAERITPDIDVVVHSAAVPDHDPERVRARELGHRIERYADFVGAWLAGRPGVAVAGTHGKTTTTSMLAEVLDETGFDPDVIVGGVPRSLGRNFRIGDGGWWLVEACEYARSFHALHPAAAVITNVEHDHPDIYPTADDIVDAFVRFTENVSTGGVVAIGTSGALSSSVAARCPRRVVRFSVIDVDARPAERADWTARVIEAGPRARGDVFRGDERRATIEIAASGRHNIENALGSFVIAAELGAEDEQIARGLSRFDGTERRGECVGTARSVTVYDDYGHHPTEVACAIEGIRAAESDRPLHVLFQAHQLGRLSRFGDAFAESLARADRVWIAPTYSVRESREAFASDLSERLVAGVEARGVHASALEDVSLGLDQIAETIEPDGVCVVIGAGDIAGRARELLGRLAGSQPTGGSTNRRERA